MPLVIAAAIDQTGRTITLLSAGLLAVAVGLTALTVWYWRFTSPRRRVEALAVQAEIEAETEPVTDTTPGLEPSAEGDELPPDQSWPVESASDDAVSDDAGLDDAESVDAESVDAESDDMRSLSLDDDQWEMLSQAVFESYLDTPSDTDDPSTV